jgi:exopolysaccharide biosynthesis polyprenyl glycosylphosphotransferase
MPLAKRVAAIARAPVPQPLDLTRDQVADRPSAVDPVWATTYASLLVVMDCVLIFGALVTAYQLRFAGTSPGSVRGVSYAVLLVVAGPIWLAALVGHRCYDVRTFGAGPTEFRRVFAASTRLFALVAVVCFAFKLSVSRAFLSIAWALGLSLLLLGRYAARKWLHHQRSKGGWSHRVLVVGDVNHIDNLAKVFARDFAFGYSVVGGTTAVVTEDDATPGGVPLLGPLTGTVQAARNGHCDTIAITASPGVTSATLRHLAWDLEGTGIALVVAPALTDVAGPRISINPVAGLPLLHVDEPQLGVVHRTVKRVFDIALSVVALLVLAPAFAAIALAVKAGSRGPVIFQQTRVGRDGREFCAYKFRSMHVNAEQRLDALRESNDAAGLLFKMRDDPRVTGIGRWLRRYSLDELPQIWNVLRGDMSLVGPRPPLPREVAEYEIDVRRRLLVKPGITGLWQVSGRSDLSWEDSVRLDLYYVENWSPVLDFVILARTVVAVIRGRGAY